MSDIAARIRQVHAHVDGLRKERDQFARAQASLQEDLRDTRRSLDVLQARIVELERENEVLRAVRPAPMAVSDRSGSKERIDELVIEIDRCLALLNP